MIATVAGAWHAATDSAAKILGARNDRGTIEVGKLANLVIIDADATVIRYTRKIMPAMQAGRPVD